MNEIERSKKELSREAGRVRHMEELYRLHHEEYDEDKIEALLDELVEIATVGQQDCAVEAQQLLAERYRPVAEKRKADIISGILDCTAKNLDDSAVFFLGFNFALKLKWKELFVTYIDLYDEQLKKEFDDDYIEWLELSEYLD